MMDRDEPVVTAVSLLRDADREAVATTQTDGDGYYSFSVTRGDVFLLDVSVFHLLDNCDDLRREPGESADQWPGTLNRMEEGEWADVLVESVPTVVRIGDVITLVDLELYCD